MPSKGTLRQRSGGTGRLALVADGEVKDLANSKPVGALTGLLDYEAAARYLCTTPRHVRKLWESRHLAAIKVGRCARFQVADLDAFVAAHRVPPAR
jgi:excisionase family DNA binding protein